MSNQYVNKLTVDQALKEIVETLELDQNNNFEFFDIKWYIQLTNRIREELKVEQIILEENDGK
jgi:hypothetical protein